MPRNQCEREEPASEAAHILKPGLGPRQAVEIGQERLAGRQADWHTPVVIPALVASVLAALGGLHVYWACGGSWGRRVAVPEVSGRPAFVPSTRATSFVAIGLFSASGVALLRGFFLLSSFPGSPAHWASVLLGLVFLLRAVGDFRLIGFFKRVRGTAFATWDTRLFSPICAALAAGFFWIAAS